MVVGDDMDALVTCSFRPVGAPPGQDRTAPVALDTKAGDAMGRDGKEPDDLSAVVEDQRAGLVNLSGETNRYPGAVPWARVNT